MSLNRPLNEGVVGAMLPQVGGLVSESVGLGGGVERQDDLILPRDIPF